MRYTAIVGLAMLAFAPTGAKAETARFGLQAFVGFPKADLALGKDVSFEIGAHLDHVLSDENLVRPRIDAVFFPSSSKDSLAKPVDTLGLGCDYIHFLGSATNPVYGSIGASLVRWSFSNRDASLKPSLRFSLGFRVSKQVSVEAQYEYSSVLSNWSSKALKMGVSFSIE